MIPVMHPIKINQHHCIYFIKHPKANIIIKKGENKNCINDTVDEPAIEEGVDQTQHELMEMNWYSCHWRIWMDITFQTWNSRHSKKIGGCSQDWRQR